MTSFTIATLVMVIIATLRPASAEEVNKSIRVSITTIPKLSFYMSLYLLLNISHQKYHSVVSKINFMR